MSRSLTRKTLKQNTKHDKVHDVTVIKDHLFMHSYQ